MKTAVQRNQIQLITYIDRLSGGKITDLHHLLDGPLAGLFDGVHLLPFYPPIDGEDAGFDPTDHTAVDSRLGDWNDIRTASDVLAYHGVRIETNPTRHGATRGHCIYFFDPAGNRNEVFCGGDYHYPDHPVVTWTADQLGKAIFYHDRQLNERFLTVLT